MCVANVNHVHEIKQLDGIKIDTRNKENIKLHITQHSTIQAKRN